MYDLAPVWPDLPYAAWRETAATLHLWTQVVGKVRLALTPWVNHGWLVPLYVSSRGLTTSPIPIDNESSRSSSTSSATASSPHQPRRRAFSRLGRNRRGLLLRTMNVLGELGVIVAINEVPSEVLDPIRFSQTGPTRPMTPPPSIASGVLSSRPIAFSPLSQRIPGKGEPGAFVLGQARLRVTRFSGRRRRASGRRAGLPDAVNAKHIRTR